MAAHSSVLWMTPMITSCLSGTGRRRSNWLMSRYLLAFDLFPLMTLVQLHHNWSPGSPLRASCLCSAPTTLYWRLCFIPWIPTSLSLVENLTSIFGLSRARLSPRDRACLRWSHDDSCFRNLSCCSSPAVIVKWSPCVFVSLLFSLETREAKICVVCSICWEWRCYHGRLQWKYLHLGQRYNLNRSEWSQPFLQGIQALNLQTATDWLTDLLTDCAHVLFVTYDSLLKYSNKMFVWLSLTQMRWDQNFKN